MSKSPSPVDSNDLPILLMIHGTSAGDDADEGERWWQQGSHAWKAFEERLGHEVDIPDSCDQEIFHWSGENGERARHQAAMDLLEKILGFERQGRAYHLIGHSHGGSVIWLALQLAVSRRWSRPEDQETLQLKGLRSWATVGTPFLQFQGSILGHWQGKVIGALTFLFVAGMLGFLAWHLNQRFELHSHWEEFRAARQKAYASKTVPTESVRDAKTTSDKLALRGREQILETGERFSQAIGNEVLRVSNVTRPNTIFDWVLLVVIGVAAPILASTLFIGLTAIRIEAQSVRREARIKNEAFLQFGARWLGIWSKEDEAINGLRGSLRLSGQVMPRLAVPNHRVFISDRVVQFNRRIVRWIIAPLYNRLVAPSGDEFLWVRLSKTAQGHDRPGCTLSNVTEGPICLPDFRYPPIPDDLDRSLIEGANAKLDKRAGAILTQARSALSQYAWGSACTPALVGTQSSVMHGDELVHTSYFNHPEVLDLLSLHIEQANRAVAAPESPGAALATPPHEAWGEWLANFKAKIHEGILHHAPFRSGGLPELGHPNWLALIALGLWLSVLVLPPLYLFLRVPHPLAFLSQAVGLSSTGAVAGALLMVSIIAFPLAGFILSFRAVHRAALGAHRGPVARFIVEVSFYGIFVAAVGFGGWSVWDRFFSKDEPIPDLALGFREAEGNLITATKASIKLRHLSTGRVRATIDARQVRCVSTSGDQSKVAYATESTIHVIDLASRKPLPVIDAYGVKSIALNAAGLLVASGHRDGAVQLWYSPTGALIANLEGHRDWVRAIAFHPAGAALATGSDDHTIRLWNEGTASRSTILSGHTGPLRTLAYHPNGTILASGANGDDSIRLWTMGNAQPLLAQAAHPGGVRSLSFNASGTLLASGGSDNCVRIWSVEPDRLVLRHSLPPHPEIISSVVFDRSGDLLASRCRSQLIKIWNPASGKLVRSLTDFDAEINSTVFLPDSSGVMISSDHVHARVVDPDSGKILTSVMAQDKVLISAVSPKGNLLATADGTRIQLWDAKTGDWLRQMGDESTGHTDDVYALAFSPDGTTLASGSDDNHVILWTVASGAQRAILTGHSHWVRDLAFSPNGRQLASASYDQTVRLWNAQSSALEHTLTGHTQSVRTVAYRSDGKMLASGGPEPLIRLWEPATGREIKQLELTEPGEVTALAFQPKSTMLASAGNGNTVKVWDTLKAVPILTLEGHFLPVTALSFDPDGSRLASGSKDFTVRIWDTMTGGLLNIIGDSRP